MTGKETINFGFLFQAHFEVLVPFGSFTHLAVVLYTQRGPHSNHPYNLCFLCAIMLT